MRPGRFDRHITIDLPTLIERKEIFEQHLGTVVLDEEKTRYSGRLAQLTPGFSGADLANLINEGALMAARRNKRMVSMADFEDAKDKVMMGAERKSMAMSEEEKKLTAYHEGGHAILALTVPSTDPVHKATIVPRGVPASALQNDWPK